MCNRTTKREAPYFIHPLLGSGYGDGYKAGIEAYKHSLRERIEKQIKYHEDTGPMAQESRSVEIGMLKRFLKDMELVTPK
jgi:hypothetical protein